MTHDLHGRTNLHTIGKIKHTISSDGAPQPDGVLKNADRKKILLYLQLYADLSDPIAFMSVAVNTSGRLYDDFLRLQFLHAHREASAFVSFGRRILRNLPLI